MAHTPSLLPPNASSCAGLTSASHARILRTLAEATNVSFHGKAPHLTQCPRFPIQVHSIY